jgi:hypothetical protein
MESQKPEEAHRAYNRFWYSLGLFLPLLISKWIKCGSQNPDQTFLRHYVRVHVLLGWILIPIVLAELAGLIK